MAVFLTDDGSLSPAGIYLSFGLPLLLIENKARHFNGFLFYFGIILSVFCLVLFVLFRLKESRMGQKRLIRKDEPLSSIINKLSDHSESRDYVVQCIHALYMAINAEKIAHAKANDASAQKPPQNSKADSMLDLNIQQLISHCLEKHPNDDLIGNVCFGLMTAFATSKSFATAIVEEADTKGIDTHIKFMKRSLERSKNESETDEKSQVAAAELQRKGALMLGAIADQSIPLAVLLAKEDALAVVLDAMKWFKNDAPVVQWCIFALFNLCYDNTHNKCLLIEIGGIDVLVSAVGSFANGGGEIVRQGVGILFDLMRITPEIDYNKVRGAALAAGVLEVLAKIKEEGGLIERDENVKQMCDRLVESVSNTPIKVQGGIGGEGGGNGGLRKRLN
ncbi:hypothetical protein ScalyP_jg5918 [Parmales sp. scaly parma]|nr:hypothetical protein ScalyP_jg5918 [Parmales sp. scaly parma]